MLSSLNHQFFVSIGETETWKWRDLKRLWIIIDIEGKSAKDSQNATCMSGKKIEGKVWHLEWTIIFHNQFNNSANVRKVPFPIAFSKQAILASLTALNGWSSIENAFLSPSLAIQQFEGKYVSGLRNLTWVWVHKILNEWMICGGLNGWNDQNWGYLWRNADTSEQRYHFPINSNRDANARGVPSPISFDKLTHFGFFGNCTLNWRFRNLVLNGTLRDVQRNGWRKTLRPRNRVDLLIGKSLHKTATLWQIPRTSRKRRILARNQAHPREVRSWWVQIQVDWKKISSKSKNIEKVEHRWSFSFWLVGHQDIACSMIRSSFRTK
jgi:hypothetical protein